MSKLGALTLAFVFDAVYEIMGQHSAPRAILAKHAVSRNETLSVRDQDDDNWALHRASESGLTMFSTSG